MGNCPACEPRSPRYRPHQAAECSHELCHGLYAATSDPDRVGRWWDRWPQANIGARVPASLLVVDLDPRHGGLARLAEAFAQLLQPGAERLEDRVVDVPGDPRGDQNLHLSDLRLRIAASGGDIFDDRCVKHDGFKVITWYLNLHVAVDQLQGLGAEGMPDELAGVVAGPDGLIDVGQPSSTPAVTTSSPRSPRTTDSRSLTAVCGTSWTAPGFLEALMCLPPVTRGRIR
jgi:hypothetical protein